MDDQDKKATEIPAFLRRRPVGAGDGGTYVVGEQWYQSEIERLQRELLQSDRDYGDAEKRYLSESAKRTRAERERDEARAIIERWRGLLNEAANALGREHEGLVGEICVALGGEG